MLRKWRVWTTTLVGTALAVFFGGMEALLILVIRGPYSRGVSWPVTLMGVLAATLLIIGYVPIPFELWKRRGRVVGIDFGFLTIDWFGAFFSLMALGELVQDLHQKILGLMVTIVAQHTFDVLGAVLYAAWCVLIS